MYVANEMTTIQLSTFTNPTSNSNKSREISECSLNHHNQELNYKIKKIVIAMIGLPARGKTYISKKIERYFNWIGVLTKVFNVEEYEHNLENSYYFVDLSNTEAQKNAQLANEKALYDLIDWLSSKGELAIFDANNTTRDRRTMISDLCSSHGIEVIFLEILCDEPGVIKNKLLEVKIDNPDFIEMTKDGVVEEFEKRIKWHESLYQPLDKEFDVNSSFICMYNQGSKYLINKVHGNLQSRIVYYLLNLRPVNRTLYICRHGESESNVLGRIGGNSDITSKGQQFAQKLGIYFNSQEIPDLKILTSRMKRTQQTAEYIKCNHIEKWKALNEIDAGKCEEMTYEEIQNNFPLELAQRDQDKFHFRYPMGESYQDLASRLEPVIMELERQHNVLVICHQAVARCLLAYFLDRSNEELPYLRIPLHTILKLTLTAYKCILEEIPLNVDAVDTNQTKHVV